MSFKSPRIIQLSESNFSLDKLQENNPTCRGLSFSNISSHKNLTKSSTSYSIISLRKYFAVTPRSTPKNFQDTESLKQENDIIKSKLFHLEQDNNLLKKRLQDIEYFFSHGKKERINDFKHSNHKPNQASKLKSKLRKLKEKLKNKESLLEDRKLKIRNKKIIELEEQISIKVLECVKLKEHLFQALRCENNQDNRNEKETKAKVNEEELTRLKLINLDYERALDILNKEFYGAQSRLIFLEKTTKKKKKQNKVTISELKKAQLELDMLKNMHEEQKADLELQRNDILKTLDKIKKTGEERQKKLTSLEYQIKEKIESIQRLRKMTQHYKSAIRKSRTMRVIDDMPIKLQNPPVFFIEIHNIISKKNMIIEVFLSLIDKNNKGMLTSDEIFTIFNAESQRIDKKYIENALKIMGCTEKYIPLSKIEEWYGKYDYEDMENDSLLKPLTQDLENSKRSEKGSFSIDKKLIPEPTDLKQNPKLGFSRTLQCKKTKTIIKTQELVQVFEEIATKMKTLNIPKTSIATALLGEDFDDTLPIFYEDLDKRIKNSMLCLNNSSHISLLAKYLCTPDNNSDNMNLQVKFSHIKDKLIKNIQSTYTVLIIFICFPSSWIIGSSSLYIPEPINESISFLKRLISGLSSSFFTNSVILAQLQEHLISFS